MKQYFPATARNRGPILDVLRDHLRDGDRVLELASGSGEHAAWIAPRLPRVTWQPSDADPALLDSIAAWAAEVRAPNLLPPIPLDVAADPWPPGAVEAVVAINLIHIAPWTVTEALFDGAARIVAPGGLVYLYGPYRVDGRHTAPSNAAFDESLRSRDPSWGVRDLEAVSATASAAGFDREAAIAMPANNLSVVFRRPA